MLFHTWKMRLPSQSGVQIVDDGVILQRGVVGPEVSDRPRSIVESSFRNSLCVFMGLTPSLGTKAGGNIYQSASDYCK